MKKLLNTLKEIVKDIKRKTITLVLSTQENGITIAKDTVTIVKENIKNITLENNQIVIEYISSYKAKRGLTDTIKVGFSLSNENYMILDTLKDGRTIIDLNNERNDLSVETRTCATCNGSLTLGEFGSGENIKEVPCKCCDNGIEYKINVVCSCCGTNEYTWSKNKKYINNYKCFDCTVNSNSDNTNNNNELEKYLNFAKSLSNKEYQEYRLIALTTDPLCDCFNNGYNLEIINFIEFMYNEVLENGKLINFTYELIKNESKHNRMKRYFKSTNPGHKDFIVIEGTAATIKYLNGLTIWKTSTKNIIKDFGHKDVNTYIKHLKKLNYIEVNEDITNEIPEDPQIEKWNNRLNTQNKINHQLDVLKRVINKRKSENINLNLVPCNGFIISKLLQNQGVKIQYNRNDYAKCYYSITDSTEDTVKVIFKDINNNMTTHKIYTNYNKLT